METRHFISSDNELRVTVHNLSEVDLYQYSIESKHPNGTWSHALERSVNTVDLPNHVKAMLNGTHKHFNEVTNKG